MHPLPLLEEELARAFGPHVRFVHGAQGIARRIAQLTEGQEYARQRPDRALFTGPGEFPGAYGEALARYGLPEGGRF